MSQPYIKPEDKVLKNLAKVLTKNQSVDLGQDIFGGPITNVEGGSSYAGGYGVRVTTTDGPFTLGCDDEDDADRLRATLDANRSNDLGNDIFGSPITSVETESESVAAIHLDLDSGESRSISVDAV